MLSVPSAKPTRPWILHPRKHNYVDYDLGDSGYRTDFCSKRPQPDAVLHQYQILYWKNICVSRGGRTKGATWWMGRFGDWWSRGSSQGETFCSTMSILGSDEYCSNTRGGNKLCSLYPWRDHFTFWKLDSGVEGGAGQMSLSSLFSSFSHRSSFTVVLWFNVT